MGVSLGRLDVAVSQHSTDRFDGNTSFQSNQGRKGVATDVEKKKLYEQQIREESITQFAVCQLISLYSST